jgi:hypothetical protein
MSNSDSPTRSGGVSGLAVLSLDDRLDEDGCGLEETDSGLEGMDSAMEDTDSGLEEIVEELVGLLGDSLAGGAIASIPSSSSTCKERETVHSSSSSSSSSSRRSSSEWCEER